MADGAGMTATKSPPVQRVLATDGICTQRHRYGKGPWIDCDDQATVRIAVRCTACGRGVVADVCERGTQDAADGSGHCATCDAPHELMEAVRLA